jgi:hypothetical protein
MIFIRPKDPDLAMRLANELMGKSGPDVDERWQGMIREQDYFFVGYVAQVEKRNYLGRKKVELWVADTNGELIGLPKTGDSLVSIPEFVRPDWWDTATLVRAQQGAH